MPNTTKKARLNLALTTALRVNERLGQIPIMLLTAWVDVDPRLQALQLGITDYMAKPFHEAELLARIQNLLRRWEEQVLWQQKEPDEPNDFSDSNDEVWIARLQQLIRQQLTNPDFNIIMLAETVNLSERQFRRRIKMLTGLLPNQLIQEIRLQVARDVFDRQSDSQVKTVAYQVGYQKTWKLGLRN